MFELTDDNKKTLDFIKELADQAFTEAKAGDASLANRLSRQSSAFNYYFTNVATRGVMTPEQWARQMPQLLKEAEALRKDYERALKADENEARLNKIEAEIAKLPDLIREALAEVIKPTEAETPVKGKGKAKAQPEAETVTETEAETDAESEA